MKTRRAYRLIRRHGRGYAVAFGGVVVTYVARLLADPVLQEQSPFLFFVLPVAFAVLYAGRGPGVLAGLLSLFAGLTFVGADKLFDPPTLLQSAAFVLIALAVGWLHGLLTLERRRARGSERQLQLLLEGADRFAIFMVDPAGTISTWNSGAERLFRLSAKEAIGRHCSELLPDHDGLAITEMELTSACEQGRYSAETWQLRADGSEFLADLTISPIWDDLGRLRGYAKVIHDGTDRKASEQALARREEHLQSILATVPEAMIVIDDKGVIQSFSPAAERLFGYTQSELAGRNVSLLMPAPDRDHHDEYIARFLQTGVPRIIGKGRIVSGLRANGTTFPMKLSIGEARTSDQRLFTGFIEDLTEKRDFEAKIEEMRAELIHVSRLSAMGTMASTLAHELNQPLTAIATYAQAAAGLLDREAHPGPEMLREVVTEVGEQALRAGGIVRRLREFVSRGDLAKSIEDLPGIIEEASALALVGTKEKGIATRFRFDPEATPVLVDRVQIQQVLINLMRNAVEAMEPSPERTLEVSTHLVDEATAAVSVRDTGPGIEPQVRAHLFEAFNTSKAAGMGLGLSICRTIVEAHGGKIEAIECEPSGTEFRFTLPRPS